VRGGGGKKDKDRGKINEIEEIIIPVPLFPHY